MKYVCGLVSYFPDEKVLSKIVDYTKSFDLIFLFDNTPSNKTEIDLKKRLRNYTNVKIIKSNENLGLSYAYSYFVSHSLKSFDFLCLLDQDSLFSDNDITNIKKFIEGQEQREKVAIFAPKVIYSKKESIRENSYRDTNFVISSGSFINLALLRNNSSLYFDKNYFIDRVDKDFCKKCIDNSYRIIVYNNSLLYQELGSSGVFRQHNYIRHYYIFRNRFYYNSKYQKWNKIITPIQIVKQCFRILIGEDNKLKKLNQLFLAYDDFKKGLMGKGRY